MFSVKEFSASLSTEPLDTYLFRGQPLKMALKRVFGGQVLAQALFAGSKTVPEERRPHSLHGYFLRPGRFDHPIIYDVDPIRDGGSFSTRRVVAKQYGEAIFNCSISFHKIEPGAEHQMDLPGDVPPPDEIEPDHIKLARILKDQPERGERLTSMYLIFDPEVIELRSPYLRDFLDPQPAAPTHGFWFKISKKIGDDPLLHRAALAYISDKGLLSTGARPHPFDYGNNTMMGASLDHAMWFHRDIRVDQWLYYHMDSPNAARARAFNRGSIYTQDGRLIASTAQEGLMRVVKRAPKT